MSYVNKLLNTMRETVVIVTIEKEDGTISDLHATINPEFMPADKAATFKEKHGPSYCVIWCVKRKGFRNITFSHVIAIDGKLAGITAKLPAIA